MITVRSLTIVIFCSAALDVFDSCTGSFPLPRLSIWNESAHRSETGGCKAV